MHGRVDLALYQTSLKTCENFIAEAYGGASNRPGTRYVGGCYSNTNYCRLVPFVFSAEQSYVLEFSGGLNPLSGSVVPNGGDGVMQIWSRGKQLVYSEDGTTDAGVAYSAGDPIRVDVPWYVADLRKLKFSQSGDVLTVTHPLYPPCQIVRRGAEKWAIRKLEHKNGPFQSINIHQGTKVFASAPTGRVTVEATGEAIFSEASVGQLFFMEQRGYGIPWEPSKDVAAGSIRRSDGKYYLAKNTGKTGTLRPTHDTPGDEWWDGGPNGETGGGVKWEYLHPGFGVGRVVSVGSDGSTASVEVLSRFPDGACGADLSSGTGPKKITALQEGPGDDLGQPITRAICSGHGYSQGDGWFNAAVTINYYTNNGDLRKLSWGWREALAAGDDEIDLRIYWDTFSDLASIADGSSVQRITNPTDGASEPTYRWAFGAWGGEQGWPSCSAYFQQRHCFAGSLMQPQAVWASKTGDYEDFGESRPSVDNDALQFTVASQQIDGITALLPLDKLVLFTLGGNWVTPSEPITPTNLAVKLQNYFGSTALNPIGLGNVALYYGKSGAVRDMAYDFASDAYVGSDLTVKAAHLLQDHSIVEWDAQQFPYPIVWMVRDDGELIGMTYLREEKVLGWHHHNVGGIIESIAVINECGEDHVYLVVKRTINGSTKRYVECMYARCDDFYEACFVDSALTYDGRNVTIGYYLTVSGGSYAQGATVTVVASGTVDGVACAPFVAGDVGDQVVVEAADGTRVRITITSYTSSTEVAGTLGAALPADLQAAATDSWALARAAFNELDHLEGEVVSIYADGGTYPGTVSAGVVSLPYPGYVVTVGLPITATLETLPLAPQTQNGTMIENNKLISQVRILVRNSQGCYVGADADHLQFTEIRSPNDEATLLGYGSGFIEASVEAKWDRNGVVMVQHVDAGPLSVLGVLPDATLGMP